MEGPAENTHYDPTTHQLHIPVATKTFTSKSFTLTLTPRPLTPR